MDTIAFVGWTITAPLWPSSISAYKLPQIPSLDQLLDLRLQDPAFICIMSMFSVGRSPVVIPLRSELVKAHCCGGGGECVLFREWVNPHAHCFHEDRESPDMNLCTLVNLALAPMPPALRKASVGIELRL
ncbi:hypothetical protein LIER_06752 [Lithospermum erythrorhizon]|uniref:Uncharacterized protein n=1 Tax=Lithospermum erythrorhizon TaxID=34254 RepID=A0AAV3PAA7_LITER